MNRLIFATPLLLLSCLVNDCLGVNTVIYETEDGLYYNLEKMGEHDEKNWKKLRLLTLYAQRLFHSNMRYYEDDDKKLLVTSSGPMIDYFKGKFPPEMEDTEVNRKLYHHFAFLKGGAEKFVANPIHGRDERYVVYITRENVGVNGFQFPDFFTELPVEKIKVPKGRIQTPYLDFLNENSPYLTFLKSLKDEKLGQLNNLLMAGSVFQSGHMYVVQGTFCTLNGFIFKIQRPVYQHLSIPWLGFTALVIPKLHPNVKTVCIMSAEKMSYKLHEAFPEQVKLGRVGNLYSLEVGVVGKKFPSHQVINSVDSYKIVQALSELKVDGGDSKGPEDSDVPEDSDQLVDVPEDLDPVKMEESEALPETHMDLFE